MISNELIITALAAHEVKCDEILNMDLVDEYRMPIDETNVDIVPQFKSCSHFFVEILVDYRHSDLSIVIEVRQWF